MGWRELLDSVGEGARAARSYISPWQYLSATDVASMAPGGGLVNAWQDSGRGWQNLKAGNWGQAAIDYGNMGLNLASEMPALGMAVMAGKKGVKGIRAFHGSPHDFDRFDMSKIGTGEGAQAYGHGLYFAENEGVARGYRDAITQRDPTGYANAHFNAQQQVQKFGNDPEWASEILRDQLKAIGPNGPNADKLQATLDMITSGRYKEPLSQTGRMYEVRINADPEHFLDWDKPLSEQSAKVREALRPVGGRAYSDAEFKSQFGNVLAGTPYEGMSARNVLEPLLASGKEAAQFVDLVRQTHPDAAARLEQALASYGSPTGEQVYKSLGHSSRSTPDIVPSFDRGVDASQALREAGIPGIKYLDAGSRTAGDGSRNYVVFDDRLVEILKKYGWMPGMAIPAAAMLEYESAGQPPQM